MLDFKATTDLRLLSLMFALERHMHAQEKHVQSHLEMEMEMEMEMEVEVEVEVEVENEREIKQNNIVKSAPTDLTGDVIFWRQLVLDFEGLALSRLICYKFSTLANFPLLKPA